MRGPGAPWRPGAGPPPDSAATGIVKVKRAPRPTPPLSARMRPPWASTRPLQMASPSPPPPMPPSWSPAAVYLRNSWPRWSGAMPRPSSVTETATCSPSRSAAIRMGADSGDWRAALASRLLSTCTMRCRSAMTRGSSGGRSMLTVCRPPPLTNVPRAWSTSAATSEGSGATDSVPVSMRPASSRSPIRLSMRSACSSMMRKNCVTSAGPKMREARSTVAAEPLIEVSGARSSWLTRPRNSARMRSSSRSGSRSCMVTTTEASAPSGPWIGVALMSVVTLRPSADR